MDSLLILIVVVLIGSVVFYLGFNVFSVQSQEEDLYDLNLTPDEVLLHFKTLVKKGERDVAYYLAQKYLVRKPKHSPLRYLYAKSLYEDNNFIEALKNLNIILKDPIRNSEVYLLCAKCNHAIRNHKTAIEQLKKVLVFDYQNEEALLFLAKLYMENSQKKTALKMYINYINYATDKDNIKEARIIVADLEYELKNWKDLLKVSNTILQYDQDNLKILKYQALSYMNLGNFDASISVLEKCLQIDQTDYSVYENLSKLYYEKEEYEKVLDLAKTALNLPDADVAMMQNLIAKTYLQMGDINLGFDILKDALEYKPNNLYLLQTLAYAYLKINEFQEAINILKKLFDEVEAEDMLYIKSTISSYYCQWAEFLCNENDYESVFDKLNLALQFDEKNPEIFHKMALVNYKIKNYTEALKQIKVAIEAAPNVCQYYLDLGRFNLELENLYEATEAFKDACAIEPENFQAQFELGCVYAKLKDVQNAILHLSIAEKCSSQNSEVKYHLALLFETTDNIQKAIEKYEEVLALEPDHPEANKNLQLHKNFK